MNKKHLELFSLGENPSKEELKAAYESLRARYLEERFMDGERGNNAARMLTQIETAYSELLREIEERPVDGDSYAEIEKLIKEGNLPAAQSLLDSFNERGGKWHYFQALLFYRKNWINESKKQLEIAIQLEPENEKYKETYRKLNAKMSSDAANDNTQNIGGDTIYKGQTMNSGSDNQMGGSFCANCIECCAINMCIDCLCDAICHGC